MVSGGVKSIADQVSDRLRSELLAGIHAVGEPMREEELASRFGVSRHPIRRAIQKLTMEGLLAAKPNCGAVVSSTATEHIVGLLTPMRKMLESYAIQHAFPKINSKHLDQWNAIVKQMARAGEDQDEQASLDCDAQFHQLILVAAELEDLVPLWLGIFGRMRDFHRKSNAKTRDLRIVAFVHQELLSSLLSGDLARACSDLGSHIEGTEFHERTKKAWDKKQRAIAK